MHNIIKEYNLDGEFRWLVAQKDPVRNGEIYRFIAGGCIEGEHLRLRPVTCSPASCMLEGALTGRNTCTHIILPASQAMLSSAFQRDAIKCEGRPQRSRRACILQCSTYEKTLCFVEQQICE